MSTYCEEHKVLLVALPDTVVDPGTVVVHLSYAAFANTVRVKGREREEQDISAAPTPVHKENICTKVKDN